MNFALPRQDHVLGFGILLEHQRRIFLDQLGDGGGELDFVLAVLRCDRQAIDRASASRCRALRHRDLAVDSGLAGADVSSRASATVSPAARLRVS